jgi:hypothetical protein
MTDMVLITVAPGGNATVKMELVPAAAIVGRLLARTDASQSARMFVPSAHIEKEPRRASRA